MEFTPRQLAHVLAALRYCQDKDLCHLPHFDGTNPLAPGEVDFLCETLNAEQANVFTVVGLYLDSEWGEHVRESTFVERVAAKTPAKAAATARKRMASVPMASVEGRRRDESSGEIENHSSRIEVIAVFQGMLRDLYDPDDASSSV